MIKEIAESYSKGVWTDKDPFTIDRLIHKEAIIHSTSGDFIGPNAMKSIVKLWWNGFPDLVVADTAVICQNDKVVIQWTSSGTHQGTFKSIPATGKRVTYSGATIYKIKDGKIIEYWAYLDMPHLLSQLGKL